MRFAAVLIIFAVAAMLSGCQQYYESRIDKLYERCDVTGLLPRAIEECIDQTHKLADAYSSPRLDALLQKLERNAEPPPPPTRAGHEHNEEGAGSGYGPNDVSSADRGGYGEDGSGEEPFQPDYDMVPPREPEQPTDPD